MLILNSFTVSYELLTVVVLVVGITAQQYGQRIGRRNRQNNFAIRHSSPARGSSSNAPARKARINSGYSYVPPSNPLLLPSNSDQQISTAVKSQVAQLPAPVVEVIRVQPVTDKPTTLAPAAQNLVPVKQQQQSVDDEIPFWDFRESIPGEPELDYPILDKIPPTSFRCNDQLDGEKDITYR